MSGTSVEAGALLRALRNVLSAVDRRVTMPILGTVHLASSRAQLAVAGTNLDLEIRAHLPAVGDLTATCVNPHVLMGLLKGLKASEVVTLEPEAGNAVLRVRIGDEQWSLPALPAEDWPALPFGPQVQQASLSLDAGWMGDALARVAQFMSSEDTRYYLNGVLLEAEGDKLLAVATDGHRLGRVERVIPGAAEAMAAAGFADKSCIIPRDMVRAILAHMRGPVTATLSSAPLMCRVKCDDLTITAKMIDGIYPDYRRVIEEPKDVGYEIDRFAFLSALARLKAISNRGTGAMVSICWRQGRLFLERRGSEMGMASIPVPGGTLGTWPAAPLHFDRAYLATAAQQVRGSAFRLHGGGQEFSQARIIDVSDPAATFVLMPMRGDAVPHDPPGVPAGPDLRAAE